MKKTEVVKRFCKLSNLVAEKQFGWTLPADCFCGTNPLADPTGYAFAEEIMAFIEDAVKKAIIKP